MSFRDEIESIIAEEERKADRAAKRTVRTARKPVHDRFQKPTYLAVLIGKLLFILQRKKMVNNEVNKQVNTEPVKKVTAFTLIKEDLREIKYKFRRRMRGKKSEPRVLVSDESFDDWKEYFEENP